MGLPARQQQILDVIDRQLSAADPQLAAEFRAFSGGAGCPPGPWQIRRRGRPRRPGLPGGRLRARARLAAVVPAAVLAVLGTVTMSLSGPQVRACSQSARPAPPAGGTAQPLTPLPPGPAAGQRLPSAGLPVPRCQPRR